MAIDMAMLSDKGTEIIFSFGPKLITAILTLLIGLWLIRIFKRLFLKGMKRKKVDKSLQVFLARLVAGLLKVMLLISVIGMLGVQMTSFVAVLGAAGLAVGLALQGSLANFAGGVLILLFKPFRVGEYIVAQGEGGTVHSIDILHTVLKTPDNKIVVLPNGPVANGNIVNYSREKNRKVEWTFGIGYGDDINKARKVIQKIVDADYRVLREEGTQIVVGSLGDSSVNIITRVWTHRDNYWDLFFEIQEAVKIAFDKAKIEIPYPQRDVHMKKK